MPPLVAPVVPAGSLSSAEQPVLPAGDLILRPWTASDAEVLLAAFADPAIRQWHARSVDSSAEAVDLVARYNGQWQQETAAHWAVSGADVLGRIALRQIDLDEGTAEVSYWILPAARGRGAAVQATASVTRWALGDLGLHRLDLYHSVANTASCRVAEKVGFAYEGTMRSACLHPDGWHDMHLHGMVQSDVSGRVACRLR